MTWKPFCPVLLFPPRGPTVPYRIRWKEWVNCEGCSLVGDEINHSHSLTDQLLGPLQVCLHKPILAQELVRNPANGSATRDGRFQRFESRLEAALHHQRTSQTLPVHWTLAVTAPVPCPGGCSQTTLITVAPQPTIPSSGLCGKGCCPLEFGVDHQFQCDPAALTLSPSPSSLLAQGPPLPLVLWHAWPVILTLSVTAHAPRNVTPSPNIVIAASRTPLHRATTTRPIFSACQSRRVKNKPRAKQRQSAHPSGQSDTVSTF
jgi:hypothetical protein